MSRRKFLALGAGILGGTIAAGVGYLTIHDEANQPVVERVSIPIKNLRSSMEGFTLLLLADFHLYPFTQPDLIRRVVTIANSLKPDVILLAGDYVWKDVEAVFELAPLLADLNARQGVYAIVGNHDLWTDITMVKTAFGEAKLPLLINEGRPLVAGKKTIYLAGLDDGWSGKPDLEAALEKAPAGAPVILLAHEPDLADTFARDKRIALQLSGHSHGGQIRLPGIGPLILPYLGRKYDHGLYRVKDMWLYTNRGIGCTSEPVRFNCAPEITQITLVAEQEGNNYETLTTPYH